MCHLCGLVIDADSCKPDYLSSQATGLPEANLLDAGLLDAGILGALGRTIAAKESADATGPAARIQSENALRTIPGDVSSDASVQVGDTVSGALESVGDTDWFRIGLEAGKTVRIDLKGVGASELTDPVLRIRDAEGRILAENDDRRFLLDLDSSITFTAAGNETFFIEVDSYESRLTGDYQLSIARADRPSPVDAIRGLNKLDDDGKVYVYFAEGGEQFTEDFGNGRQNFTASGFNAYERAQFTKIFDHIETFADIDFEVTRDRSRADLELASADLNDALSGATTLGFFYFPSATGQGGHGLLNDAFSGYDTRRGGSLDEGGFIYGVALHEIGHGLGLAHPHDTGNGTDVLQGVSSSGSLGSSDLNQSIFTTLSYNDGYQTSGDGDPGTFDFGYAASFGTLDIAALQELYGANTNYARGDNVYRLDNANTSGTGYAAIWDTGGRDWIVAGGDRNTTISLRAATLDFSASGAGEVSRAAGIHGGFTIANGVEIENARGGAGSDRLSGNELGNALVGGRGGDRLLAFAGNDWLEGGAGADLIAGGGGIDTASYRKSDAGITIDLASGRAFHGEAAGDQLLSIERLVGSRHADRLKGAAAGDTLLGGGGEDLIQGRSGDDALFGESGDDLVRGDLGDDRLFGQGGDDELLGGGGEDVLAGGIGADSLFGGADRDYLDGGSEADILFGGAGHDALFGKAGADRLAGENGRDRLFGGADNDNLSGGAGADQLFGGFGEDILRGGADADFLHGGTGDDLLAGGTGNDRLVGGDGADHFIFAEADFGRDGIADFGTDDLLDFSALGISLDDLAISEFNGNTRIQSGDSMVVLIGVEAASLDEDSFLF